MARKRKTRRQLKPEERKQYTAATHLVRRDFILINFMAKKFGMERSVFIRHILHVTVLKRK